MRFSVFPYIHHAVSSSEQNLSLVSLLRWIDFEQPESSSCPKWLLRHIPLESRNTCRRSSPIALYFITLNHYRVILWLKSTPSTTIWDQMGNVALSTWHPKQCWRTRHPLNILSVLQEHTRKPESTCSRQVFNANQVYKSLSWKSVRQKYTVPWFPLQATARADW